MINHPNRSKQPRIVGHKFDGCRYLVQTKCQCGWQSAQWIGKGARQNAYSEWHMHLDACQRAEAKANA